MINWCLTATQWTLSIQFYIHYLLVESSSNDNDSGNPPKQYGLPSLSLPSLSISRLNAIWEGMDSFSNESIALGRVDFFNQIFDNRKHHIFQFRRVAKSESWHYFTKETNSILEKMWQREVKKENCVQVFFFLDDKPFLPSL